VTDLSQFLKRRASLATEIRQFFFDRNVTEVTTPLLSQAGVTDPSIESFQVALNEPEARYLRTSPEFPLKRLLAAGAPDLFELGPVFRDGERGALHNPEFTLLEWYRLGFAMQDLIDEVVALLQTVCDGKFSTFNVHQIRYFELFSQVTDCDVSALDAAALGRLASQTGHAPESEMDVDQWLDFLFSTVVQSSFEADAITVVTHYPASQAALAALDVKAPHTALRFEVFVGSVELANGFEELTDAAEQASRFASDNELRKVRGQRSMPVDTRFLTSLNSLPDCSGVALGFDRLFILSNDLSSISDALPVSWSEA